ncbi:MAG: hypothetical protein RR101_02450 [Burkholderiaceae bacterium]
MNAFKKLGFAGFACCLTLLLVACEKRIQLYEPGVYKGAPLTAPWDTPQYGGQTAAWERAIETRTRNQNEYWRMQAQ